MKKRKFSLIQLLLVPLVMISTLVDAAEPTKISLISGPIGAAWYSLGSGFVKVIQSYCPDITITLEAGAAVKNVRVIYQNPNVIGFTNLDIAYYAVNGSREFDRKYPLLALMAGHPSQAYVVTIEDYGINRVEDLRGKPVSIGPPASGAETTARMILAAHGMTYNDVKPKWLSTQETCDSLRDKIIVAGFIFSGTPVPSIMELAVTHRVKIIPIRPEISKKLQEEFPYVYRDQIPSGTYKGQNTSIDTIAWDTYLVAHSSLPEETGYKIVKALLEHNKELVAAHPSGSFWTLEKTAQKMIVPRHPGALKYLQEKGMLK